MRRLLFMSKGQARPGSIPGLPAEKNKRKGENNGKIISLKRTWDKC